MTVPRQRIGNGQGARPRRGRRPRRRRRCGNPRQKPPGHLRTSGARSRDRAAQPPVPPDARAVAGGGRGLGRQDVGTGDGEPLAVRGNCCAGASTPSTTLATHGAEPAPVVRTDTAVAPVPATSGPAAALPDPPRRRAGRAAGEPRDAPVPGRQHPLGRARAGARTRPRRPRPVTPDPTRRPRPRRLPESAANGTTRERGRRTRMGAVERLTVATGAGASRPAHTPLQAATRARGRG